MKDMTLPERVFVHGRPVDMRLSFDGLEGLVREALGENPLSGDLFLFFNRRRNMVKGLIWDRTGFLLVAKRLEKGCFQLRSSCEKMVIEKNMLRRLLDGLAVGGVEISRSNHCPSGTDA